MYEEVERRIASEDRIREQVDNKVRVAVERLGDATEIEMSRMYRRIEADVLNRLDQISREIVSVSSSIKHVTRQVELVTVETRENKENLIRLERRFGAADQQSTGSDTIMERNRTELGKLKEMIDADLNNAKRLELVEEHVNRTLTNKLEVIESWLKSSLTPEVLRLKELIAAERLNRESNDASIMDIVGQYTEIMRKHFDAIMVEKDPGRLPLQAPPSRPFESFSDSSQVPAMKRGNADVVSRYEESPVLEQVSASEESVGGLLRGLFTRKSDDSVVPAAGRKELNSLMFS